MTGPARRPFWLPRLVVAFNVAAAIGCVGLAARSPSRAGILLAAGGFAFFGLAAVGFVLMLRLGESATHRGRRRRTRPTRGRHL